MARTAASTHSGGVGAEAIAAGSQPRARRARRRGGPDRDRPDPRDQRLRPGQREEGLHRARGPEEHAPRGMRDHLSPSPRASTRPGASGTPRPAPPRAPAAASPSSRARAVPPPPRAGARSRPAGASGPAPPPAPRRWTPRPPGCGSSPCAASAAPSPVPPRRASACGGRPASRRCAPPRPVPSPRRSLANATQPKRRRSSAAARSGRGSVGGSSSSSGTASTSAPSSSSRKQSCSARSRGRGTRTRDAVEALPVRARFVGRSRSGGRAGSGTGARSGVGIEDGRAHRGGAARRRAPRPSPGRCAAGPRRSARTTSLPSGAPDQAPHPERVPLQDGVARRAAPCSRPRAARGRPARRRRRTRVGAMLERLPAAPRAAARPPRHSRASTPCPTAGRHDLGREHARSPGAPAPGGAGPARASMAPARPSSSVFRSRVCTLPRSETISRSGRSAQELTGPAQRRGARRGRRGESPRSVSPRGLTQRVARVLALGHRRQHQPRRARCWSCPSGCARRGRRGRRAAPLDLLHEQPLAADCATAALSSNRSPSVESSTRVTSSPG